MNIYTQRLPTDYHPQSEIQSIALNYDTRQKCRFRATLDNGQDIGVDLPRTGVLRGGAFIGTETGEVLQVQAAPEKLLCITANEPFDLLKAAYHLGNRHVPLMLTPTALYLEPDYVLADMVRGLGLTVEEVMHPFEPESGAYAQHQHDNRLRPYHAHH
ncbi:urease accessory protein UreE [Alkanindiges hydrocarboniclasticus]|jgi:urease accessory protein|uniref:Urease accessory protein UreE n=1 Tax=Alkanindiges hydrocarboniclasticus TaxID=1907941 RepID=A0A1S8CUL3_9GAMM|nr:urease accessory protein UreE [Alkanindiges hydrocarboniclasticus]ONG39563.1 urease accessory protein UreE [Alkanindiges hydrocarboniclasticus]